MSVATNQWPTAGCWHATHMMNNLPSDCRRYVDLGGKGSTINLVLATNESKAHLAKAAFDLDRLQRTLAWDYVEQESLDDLELVEDAIYARVDMQGEVLGLPGPPLGLPMSQVVRLNE